MSKSKVKAETIRQFTEVLDRHTQNDLDVQVVLHCLCNFTELMDETLFKYKSFFQSQSRDVIERIKKSGAPEHEVRFITDLCDTVSEVLIIAGQHGEGIALIQKMRPELRGILGLDDGEE